MQRKLARLSTAIENISPAEFLSMESSDLAELERLSNCLSEQIEIQNIWRGNEVTTNPRSRHHANAQ